MDRKQALDELRTLPSPFASSAAPSDPWRPRPADVSLINGHAVDGILSLIRHLAEHPDQPVACLLEGDVGAGKTHVIGTICQRLSGADGQYSFAEVKPLLNARKPLKHLLGAVVTNLNQKPSGERELTQLDRITARLTAKFLRKTYESSESELRAQAAAMAADIEASPAKLWNAGKNEAKWSVIASKIRNWLVRESPQVSSKVLKVFLQYAVPHKRGSVIEWLKGESLDDDELAQLGLKHEEGEREIEAVEARAADTLLTLGHLLRFDRPLVVCFDQLESLEEHDSTEKIRAFAHMVQYLFNTVPSMMLVTSVRGEKWTALRERIDAAARQRIESSPFRLRACTKDWALELIRSRLAGLPRPVGASPLFPFDEPPIAARLDAALSAGTLSARLVLQKAHKLWLDEIVGGAQREANTSKTLEAWLSAEAARVAAHPDLHPPDESLLAEALRLQLHALPADAKSTGCAFLSLKVDRRPIDLVIQLQGDAHPKVACLVDNELHHLTVGASFRLGKKLRDGGHVERVIFLRDARRPIPAPPKWKVTNELRAAFEVAGGAVFTLALEEVAHWYAVVYLHHAILAGDVTVDGAALGKAHFDQFLKARAGRLPQLDEILAHCTGEA